MHFIPSVCITKHPNGIKSKIHIVEYYALIWYTILLSTLNNICKYYIVELVHSRKIVPMTPKRPPIPIQ